MPNKNKGIKVVKNPAKVTNLNEMFETFKEVKDKIHFLQTVLARATHKKDKKSNDFVNKHSEDICYLEEFFESRERDYVKGYDLQKLSVFYSMFERLNNGTLENIYKDLSPADQENFGSPKELLNDMKQICLYKKSDLEADFRNAPNLHAGFYFGDVSNTAKPQITVPKKTFVENKVTAPRKLIKLLDENQSSFMKTPLTLTKAIFSKIKTSSDSDEYKKLAEKLDSVIEKIQSLDKEDDLYAGTKTQNNIEIFPDLCELNVLAHNYMNHAKSSSLSSFSNKTLREQKMAATENLICALNGLTLNLPGFELSSKFFKNKFADAYRTDKCIKSTENKKTVLYPLPTDLSMDYLKYVAARTSAPVLRNQMNMEFIDPKAAEWSKEQREKYCCDLVVNSVLDAAMKAKDYGHPLINCMLKADGNIDTAREMVRGMDAYKNLVNNLTSPKKYLKVAESQSKRSELAAALKSSFAGKESAKLTLVDGKAVITGNAPKQEVKAAAMRIPA